MLDFDAPALLGLPAVALRRRGCKCAATGVGAAEESGMLATSTEAPGAAGVVALLPLVWCSVSEVERTCCLWVRWAAYLNCCQGEITWRLAVLSLRERISGEPSGLHCLLKDLDEYAL